MSKKSKNDIIKKLEMENNALKIQISNLKYPNPSKIPLGEYVLSGKDQILVHEGNITREGVSLTFNVKTKKNE